MIGKIKDFFLRWSHNRFMKKLEKKADEALSKAGVPLSVEDIFDMLPSDDDPTPTTVTVNEQLHETVLEGIHNIPVTHTEVIPMVNNTNDSDRYIAPAPTSNPLVDTIPSYFKPEEFVSKNDKEMSVDKLTIDPTFLAMLNHARHMAGNPWRVTSGQRSKAYNNQVGGVQSSAHIKGLAVDLSATSGSKKFEIVSNAIKAGFQRIGISNNFIHLDNDLSKPKPSIWTY